MTELFDAIRKGDAAGVSAILAAHPDAANARDASGATPALWAAYTRHSELAPLVLAGREPDFFEACALGRRERMSELLAQDPALATADSADGFSALGLAVFFGHVEIARLLVEAGADVNRRSNNSFLVSPLDSAVASGRIDAVDLLLQHGARPDSLESAIAHGNPEIVERLRSAGAR